MLWTRTAGLLDFFLAARSPAKLWCQGQLQNNKRHAQDNMTEQSNLFYHGLVIFI